ncbi:TolC family protein [bacterium]|nr:TolC family protein [bacterium]
MFVCYRACRIMFACFAVMAAASGVVAEDLSLQQALDIAIKNNPTVAAGRLSADAAKQSAKGANALTNPEILVAPSIVGDAGSDSALLFSQPLEINGSRRVRGQIASSEATAVGYDSDTTRREILLRVNQSYWDVARAQELVKLNQENITYLETVRAAVQKQYDVGTAPGAQVLKMDVELARARQELSQAQLGLQQSMAELNTLMACPTNNVFSVSEPLIFNDVCIDCAGLLTSALARRPEIASACAQYTSAQAQIKAAKLLRVPDLALQARRESFDNDSDNGVAIAINLPLLDWGSARAEERRARLAARSREKQVEAVRNNISLDIEQAVQRVNTASQVVREYQGGVLTTSEELATMARKGFEKGASSYLEVLEAQRTLRSVRSDYYSALAEHAKALAQLEWASGCAVSQMKTLEANK